MPILDALPLFPLSDVVLLPKVDVPLYVFEPRYRQMTRDALAGGRRIGMVTVRPEAVTEMAGDPPLFEIGCLGEVSHAQERPDGTFQIQLSGTSRFRILDEPARPDGRLYRTARIELVEDPLPRSEADQARLEQLRARIMDEVRVLVRRAGAQEENDGALAAFDRLEAPRFVNVLTQSISFAPIERQQLLEAESVLRRFEIMQDLLQFRLAATASAAASEGSLPN